MCISAFQRLSCKIVNLYDIDLKYLGSISDVNNNNLKTFCEVTMSRNYIFRKQANMRPSPINFWILCPQESLTSGTYFMVIRPVLSDINEELRARKSYHVHISINSVDYSFVKLYRFVHERIWIQLGVTVNLIHNLTQKWEKRTLF